VILDAMIGFVALLGLAAPLYKNAHASLDARVNDLLRRMTPEEKARQLDMYSGTEFVDQTLDNTHTAKGANVKEDALAKALGMLGVGSIHDIYPTPAISNRLQKWVIEHNRLGIPVLFLEEGVHGYNGFGYTLYPCSINLGATFDKDLAKETGAEIGGEARTAGVDMLLGPVLDVAREPRWGRIEEDFGEDPFLTGALGAAYVTGMQGDSLNSNHTVISEPKHFAGHGSPESGTNTSPVHAGEREVRSVFLRSFQPAVQIAGARGVMAAYHEIDGVPCAGNPWLLTDVLRGEWGFKGFVLSDLGAISMLYDTHHVAASNADAARMAIKAGVDMQFYDFPHDVFQNALVDGVKHGKLTTKELDRAVGHVLRVKFELGLFDHPFVDEGLEKTVVRSQTNLATSMRSSLESLCLLKNADHLLPLSPATPTIAVIGPNAVAARTGDYTPSQGVHAVSILDGIKQVADPGTKILSASGDDINEAVEVAQKANVVIIGLGERDGISGEGADRTSLDLPDQQEELLEAVANTSRPVVLVLENGRPLSIRWGAEHVPAILEAWYPGEFGGLAIAQTLFGKSNPSGHLPISFPSTVGAIPDFYNTDSSKHEGYVDGSSKPLWPFGFGLSYTTFSLGNLKVVGGPSSITIDLDVTNSGSISGDEVVQVYEHPETSSAETPARSLKGFQRVALAPGETKHVKFDLGTYELEIWSARRKWEVEPGKYNVWVGDNSAATLGRTVAVGG
jgi:beta-glucosidase